MEDIVLISISKKELESIIENSVRKILNESATGQNTSEGGMLSVKEVAEFLKVGASTIYKYTSSREIPCFKKGKRLYFSKDALMQWISEGKLKTRFEIEQEAATYLTARRKR